jgi:hypothetical protein
VHGSERIDDASGRIDGGDAADDEQTMTDDPRNLARVEYGVQL